MPPRRFAAFSMLFGLLFVLLTVAGPSPVAAAPTELFFSEYIEGSSNNKALEVYNGTGALIDLAAAGYKIEQYSNGNATVGLTINLTGTVADGDVYVVAHSSADLAILAQADQTTGAGLFNGNDALVLRRDTAVIDAIGQVGIDPGTEWGSGDTSTADNTLRRKSEVCAGDAVETDPFDPSLEWDGFPNNTFDGLGAHVATCGSTLVEAEVLLTEIVVTPTEGEFIEIHNPTAESVDLSDFFLTDATFAGGGTYYYNIVTGSNAGGGGFSDFLARFPDGATIAANEYQTIAMAGSDDYFAAYAVNPTYELFEDGGAPDGVPDMREALPGSINNQGGLTNDGEVVILFRWDGQSDLVVDHDYAVWGDKDEAVDKTGISIDGPDADPDPSPYLPDTAIPDQDVLAAGSHAAGNSWQREDLTEGAETTTGGNGVNGEDETSEDLSNTWCEGVPTPGAATFCPPPPAAVLVINEIDYDQPSTDNAEFVEIKNAGVGTVDLDAYSLVLVNGNGGGAVPYQTFDLPAVMLAAGDYFVVCGDAANVANCDLDVTPDSNLIQNGDPDAVALTLFGAIVDTVSYEGDTGAPYTEGSGVGLVDPGSSDDHYLGISRFPDGTDTGQNNVDLSTRCITPGMENTSENSDCTAPPVLVINEIDYDQPSTDTAEFIEIKNAGSGPVDLDPYVLELINGTGGGASVYRTIDLPPVALAAGDYFVVCANAVTVLNCDLDSSPDTDFIQNGAPDAVALTLAGAIVDTVSYEGDTGAPYTEGSGAGLVDTGAAGTGISRCPDGFDSNQNNSDLSERPITPGEVNSCEDPPPVTLAIYEIQGDGDTSPYVGQNVTTSGIVVADFQGSDELNGFFIQDELGDANSQTSDGIFVYDPGGLDVALGDEVEVTGLASEFNTLTEINNVSSLSVTTIGNPLPDPVEITLPETLDGELEQYEGMYVRIADTSNMVVAQNFFLGRYGQMTLSAGGRLYQPTNQFEPLSPEAIALAEENARRILILDDGQDISGNGDNPNPVPYLGGPLPTPLNVIRAGDSVSDLVGVLDFGRINSSSPPARDYRLHPTAPPVFTPANLRTAAPDPVGGTLKVASFNVLNYFTTIDAGPDICGPSGDMDCRGADSPTEFVRQQTKIVAAMAAIDADIYGLIELENNAGVNPASDGTDPVLEQLVSALNAVVGAGTYDFIDAGVIGTDAIKQAFIYKTTTVTPVGSFAILDSTFDPAFIDTRNRPVLAQTFMENATGAQLTVAVNHLKSKGSPCDGDPDTGDGQGNCNLTRLAAAEVLVDWLATDPTGSGDPDFLIIGDLNSYAREDPIRAIEGAGYTNLNNLFQGSGAYSYIFDGLSGYLDHALSNATLTPQVTGTTDWHINTDEPAVIDYDENFNPPDYYSPDPYRASDHDPIVVGLELNLPPVCTGAYPSKAVLWPPNHLWNEIMALGVTDPDGDPITITIDSIFQDERVDAPGTGDTWPDGMGIGTSIASVRAERAGGGNGRVYHIFFTASDGIGGSCSGEILVSVPKSVKKPAVDGGALFDSTLIPE